MYNREARGPSRAAPDRGTGGAIRAGQVRGDRGALCTWPGRSPTASVLLHGASGATEVLCARVPGASTFSSLRFTLPAGSKALLGGVIGVLEGETTPVAST